MSSHNCEPNRWKGFLLGTAGSVGGLILMRLYFQQVAPLVSKRFSEQTNDQQREPQPLDDIALVDKQYKDDESATAALGRLAYQRVTGKEPQTQETKTTLSNLVHWLYGMLQGGVYGATFSSAKGMGSGLVHGTGLWLFGDELAVPLLGLQSGPTAASSAQHLNRLGGHLAYGLGTAITTQFLRRIF